MATKVHSVMCVCKCVIHDLANFRVALFTLLKLLNDPAAD